MMDKPTKPEKENFRPLPKPIQLNLPSSRPKPVRRLHESDPTPTHKDPQAPKQKPRPDSGNQAAGKRYFSSAQKAYGQRRPRQPKPVKQKRRSKHNLPTGPILGKGDRLYTPPLPKEPIIPPRVKRVLKFWALGLIALAFVVMGMINVFSYNAWAVYLDDEFLGYMPINREVETYTVHNDAVQHLTDFLGAEVIVNEEARVRTARAGRRELYPAPDMIRRISLSFTYQVMASAIYLDGERIAVLRNEPEARNIADEIKRRFSTEHTLRELSAFEEDWQIVSAPASLEDMDSPDEVIQLLERPIRDIHRHTIRSGDTQGALAVAFNTTVDRIGYLNDITSDAILRVGETLLIEITRPRITVITVDEIDSIEIIPMEVETIENPDKLSSLYTEIQEGRNGEMQVRQRITRINGIQAGEPEIVHRRELSAAVTRILEVGTLETAIETR